MSALRAIGARYAAGALGGAGIGLILTEPLSAALAGAVGGVAGVVMTAFVRRMD